MAHHTVAFLKHWTLYTTLQPWCKFFSFHSNLSLQQRIINRGDRIRLVNTTLTVGSRVESVRTEASIIYFFYLQVSPIKYFCFPWADIKIWNVTHHRLVASGVHVKMPPSQPLKAALWQSVWSSMENWNIEIHDTHWQTQYPLYLFSRSHFYVRHADPSNLMKLYNKFGSRRKDGQTGDILSMPLLPITFLQEWRRNFN